jgi:AcrR family transcriptional regulator
MLLTGNTQIDMTDEPAVKRDTAPPKNRTGAAADRRLPPRERILAAARDLFYRQGIRAVGVDAIVDAAGTNKMTLYRHFPSKDELVAEYLRCAGAVVDEIWSELEARHPDDALAQLHGWVESVARLVADDERGCALANAAVELAEKDHPGRPVIGAFKQAQRKRLAGLARAAGLTDAEMLAEELHLLIEGARVTAQSIGREGLAERFVRMGEALIAAHASGRWAVRRPG